MKQRKLKVRKGHRDYTLKSKPCSGNPIIPFLLLKGTWLEQAGFTIDTPSKMGGFRLFGSTFSERLAPAYAGASHAGGVCKGKT
ncbi:MAG: type I toxin-antitoxin system SymE family toxin [Alcanivorax sp.]|nr:type I toxin-antitoxin system SymE family toxin [Alcanivorax sp.]